MNLTELQELWQENILAQVPKLPALTLNELDIEVHNATWCPDCVREVSELLALANNAAANFKSITLNSYEDKAQYQEGKKDGSLTINCLPTIRIHRQGELVLEILEDSKGGICPLIEDLLDIDTP